MERLNSGFSVLFPKQSELLTCTAGRILCMSSFTSQLLSDINIILSLAVAEEVV